MSFVHIWKKYSSGKFRLINILLFGKVSLNTYPNTSILNATVDFIL